MSASHIQTFCFFGRHIRTAIELVLMPTQQCHFLAKFGRCLKVLGVEVTCLFGYPAVPYIFDRCCCAMACGHAEEMLGMAVKR
jgi:hypothetical protein